MSILYKTQKGRSRLRGLYCALAFYVGSTALDWVSSLNFPPGVEESNPFSRHENGAFWPRHALITDSLVTSEILILSVALNGVGRMLGPKAGRVASCLPWLYFGYLHLEAALQNILLEIPGLYVQTAHDMLRRLLGN